MQIQYSRMDKVFLTHLHGDHTSDLITIYCFGPSVDRKVPLRVWGPSADTPEQGTKAFCDTLYKLMEWHRHSFSFIATGLKPPAGYDSYDGFDIIATELEYMEVGGIAYQNETTGVTIRHFPALHARNGSISYKLEWNGMSMIFSGDTKPNDFMIEQGKGVDVLIHEMVVPPEVWAAKNSGFQEGDAAWDQALQLTKDIEDSSHTPQKAFGYIMSQTNPRLAVATHFQADDETVGPALDDIRRFYDGDVTIATDLLVIDVSKDDIRLRQGDVSDFAWYPPNPKIYNPQDFAAPMYPTPTAQLSDELLAHVVQPILYNPALPPA
ncbi:MAG: ribonuclease [Candidatus Hydrogenedentes bacterium]|nr:ribonuclease [Candidatus Hydrogenedentota bacterium]